MTQEPREWWVSINILSPTEGSSGFNNDPPLVHVIEYRAYEDLAEALKQIHTKLIPKMVGRDSWTVQQKYIDDVVGTALRDHEQAKKERLTK